MPDRPFADPDAFKGRFGWSGRRVILTFGLLAPGKGIETMIEAMPAVVARHPDAFYVVLGATHPNRSRTRPALSRPAEGAGARSGRRAQRRLHRRLRRSRRLLIDYLQAVDIDAMLYLNPAQITSGTLSYAVGVGKAVISSTPYVHATEILADGHRVLVDFRVLGGLCARDQSSARQRAQHHRLVERAYARGRTMTWPRVVEFPPWKRSPPVSGGKAATPPQLAPAARVLPADRRWSSG
ncbi:hypothetical protein AB5I41_15470 [Sphingomonas sp. MMS24-JH45]